MSDYTPPLDEILWTMSSVAGLDEVLAMPAYASIERDVVAAVLEGAGQLATEVLAPLNRVGDRVGAHFENGVVRMPDGFREAYARYAQDGWTSLAVPQEQGGQGLPMLVAVAAAEMWNSANMALALCPMLTASAIHAIARHASAELCATYLPPLVEGRWTGTMNLTEPQAGSDVGAVKARALREGGVYRIIGQKIFISYGEHDLAENIVHLVLARLPGAPSGTKGLSLFLVPKYLPGEDGRPGRRNDVRCVSLEHKLGIRASPTATLAFGDEGGAAGFLVGEEGFGMECMFTMMNAARLGVGIQGLALSERVYQESRSFAVSRTQGAAAIAAYPDVRRMLLLLRARTAAGRALAYYTAAQLDRAAHDPDAAARDAAARRAALLVPVVKAWCTDMAVENTSLAVQVHGGMGYVEETGVAQHYRDARITPIYEGTNGIQAIDLLGRKVALDGGAAVGVLLAEMRADAALLTGERSAAICARFEDGVQALEHTTRSLLGLWPGERARALAGATPYLALFAAVTGLWLLVRGVLRSGREDASDKLDIAQFYADQVLAPATGLVPAIIGGDLVLASQVEAA